MKLSKVVIGLALMLAPLAASAGTLKAAMNSVGAYVEGQNVSGVYGGPDAGVGIRGGATLGNWFGTAGFHYDFGGYSDPAPSGGYIWGMDVKAGYLVPISAGIKVGPYFGYNHIQTHADLFNGTLRAGSGLDAVGGGIYAAWAPMRRLSFQAYAGYLAGIHSSVNINGVSESATKTPNITQVGALADYQLSGPVHAFAAVRYDHISNEGGAGGDQYRGLVGVSYSFG